MDDLAKRLQSALGEAYVVGDRLGAGGFAAVYRVHDVSLKRSLAVKVLSPDVIASHAVLERFRREAETVARLSHPNIVPLHWIGQKDDLIYLVMACVEGGSVGDLLKREGRLSLDDARRILSEVASALAHAHRHGVIHRDIKPQNVLLDADSGRCLVADFGIARTAEGSSLTASGMFVGTPAYLAPEQLAGESSDHRADIYALGVLGYELLSGRPPFEAPTPTAILMKRLAGPLPSLATSRPDVPRLLDEVVTRCLEQDPSARYASADDVVRTLEGRLPLLRSGGSRHRRRRAVLGAAIVGTVALAVALAVRAGSTRAGAEVARPDLDPAMVIVPAGRYAVGANDGPPISRPLHSASLNAFGLERFEVSVGDYERFLRSGVATAPWRDSVPDRTLPVTRVRWDEALRYCRWRYGAAGRLPTEEEWEAAARGPANTRYPWGAVMVRGAANTSGSGRGSPSPPGSHPRGATPDGIHDLIGNVWEWTSSPLVAYPGAPALPDSWRQFRVIRGGAFDTPDTLVAAWSRGYASPVASRDQLSRTGFRCATTPRLATGRGN